MGNQESLKTSYQTKLLDSLAVDEQTKLKIEKLLGEINKKGFFTLTRMSPANQGLIAKWATHIYDRYRSILEMNPAKIKNILDLPVSKQDVKLAIKILLTTYFAKGADDIVNRLQNHFISIGSFQHINEEDKEKIVTESNRLDQNLESIYPEYHKYLEIIISEQNVLSDDLNHFSSDLKTLFTV